MTVNKIGRYAGNEEILKVERYLSNLRKEISMLTKTKDAFKEYRNLLLVKKL